LFGTDFDRLGRWSVVGESLGKNLGKAGKMGDGLSRESRTKGYTSCVGWATKVEGIDSAWT
jgi:hypothetical protein